MDRRGYLLENLTRDTPVLEIGPSYNPLVTKADGWTVQTVDHASKADLESKYRLWGVDVSRMEEVDYIWKSGPLHEAVPAPFHGRFDRVLASHVIEHIPDMLGFLHSVTRLLTPGGKFALAVPDKRFCFDYYRPGTMTSDVLQRHGNGDNQHSMKSAFETYFYNANANGSIAWWNAPALPVALHHDWASSMQQLSAYRNVPPGTYLDMHASTFTPCAFELIITELAALALCELTVQHTIRTNAYEFFVVLEQAGPALRARGEDWIAARRTQLLRGMLEETHWQFELLRQAEANAATPASSEAPSSP